MLSTGRGPRESVFKIRDICVEYLRDTISDALAA